LDTALCGRRFGLKFLKEDDFLVIVEDLNISIGEIPTGVFFDLTKP
jgi:hypothetical protein